MKWEYNDAITYLVIGGACIATVCDNGPEGFSWATDIDLEGGSESTREAAMQAAEQAVREWLGKAVRETLAPVAFSFELAHDKRDGKYTDWSWHFASYPPAVQDGASRNVTPLYAIQEPK